MSDERILPIVQGDWVAENHDGRIVVGFHTNRELALDDFDEAVVEAGLHLDLRLATWDLRPWADDADFAVSILRRRQ